MTLGVVLAVASALVWGSGDFCGGRAATRLNPFQVLFLAAVSGIVMLVAAAMLTGESFAPSASLLWAAGAGLAGGGGIVALYRGLAIGSAATVAPLASVLAAVLPVVVGVFTEGAPRPVQLVGFALALAGIFLVARSAPDGRSSRAGLEMGLLAGLGFGGFLVLAGQVTGDTVYVPLTVARAMMLGTALLMMRARGLEVPRLQAHPIGLLAGLLDAGGNVLYLLARQHVRMDIAAVLSSLYPLSTVVLARMVTGERVTAAQWTGGALCLAAVTLIAA